MIYFFQEKERYRGSAFCACACACVGRSRSFNYKGVGVLSGSFIICSVFHFERLDGRITAMENIYI